MKKTLTAKIILSIFLLTSCGSSTTLTSSDENEIASTSTVYTLDQAGLEAVAIDCTTDIIAANDVTSVDPSIQDAIMDQIGRCIPEKEPGFICSGNAGDPVCVWNKNSVSGPRIRMLDGVYAALQAAGDPYYQGE
jgi:hypothetical protein